MLNGGTLNYFAVPWAIVNNPLPLVVVTAIEVVLLGAAENYRRKGEGPPGYSPGVGNFDSSIFTSLDRLYPGATLGRLVSYAAACCVSPAYLLHGQAHYSQGTLVINMLKW